MLEIKFATNDTNFHYSIVDNKLILKENDKITELIKQILNSLENLLSGILMRLIMMN